MPKEGARRSNSLFEDNAEFGLGMRITADKQLDLAANTCMTSKMTLEPNWFNRS